MSTVGHFITMLGVICFYLTIIESVFERKIITLTYNLVPRLYADTNYLKLKRVNHLLNKQKKTIIPKKKIKIFIKKTSF